MHDARHALADRLSRYDRLVEVGVGNRPDVASALADRGCSVTATDIEERPVPASVAFARDDLLDPDPEVYAGADAVYALNCPPELQQPLQAVAEGAGADCLFTTLGGDPATVPVEHETLAGETLFRGVSR